MTSVVLDLGITFMLNQNSNDTIWFHKTCIYKVFNCKHGQVNIHSDINMIFLWKLIHILNCHGDKTFLTRLSLPKFEVKKMLYYKVIILEQTWKISIHLVAYWCQIIRNKIPTDFAQILTLLTLYKLTIKSTTSMTCDKQVIVFMGKICMF